MPRRWAPPLSAVVLFSSPSIRDFFESKEKGRISTVLLTGILGFKGALARGHCWALTTTDCFSSSSSWVGVGSFSSQQRQESWGQWVEFLSFQEHLTRYKKGEVSHKFKVFILQYPLCFSPFDSFLHFKIKANRPGGWLLRQFLRENVPNVKNSGIQFPGFKRVEPCFYRITYLGFCICLHHLLLHFCSPLTLASQYFLGSSLYGKTNLKKNRYVFMHDCIKFLYTLYKHNIENQLYSSIK